MPFNIEKQCARLGLNIKWKNTIERYIRQFESAYPHVEITTEDIDEDRSSIAQSIHDALEQINQDTDSRTRRRLIGEAIAELPVFYLRYKVTVDGVEQFWDPLEEGVSRFLERTGCANNQWRRYTAQTPRYGKDIIVSRVFTDLGNDSN